MHQQQFDAGHQEMAEQFSIARVERKVPTDTSPCTGSIVAEFNTGHQEVAEECSNPRVEGRHPMDPCTSSVMTESTTDRVERRSPMDTLPCTSSIVGKFDAGHQEMAEQFSTYSQTSIARVEW
jgi:hypothetical protein